MERASVALIALTSGITLWLVGQRMALGVVAGGALSVVNLYVLRWLVGALLRAERPPRQVGLVTLLVFKFALMGLAIFAIVHFLPLSPLGVLLGVSLVVLSILAEGFRAAFRAQGARAERQ